MVKYERHFIYLLVVSLATAPFAHSPHIRGSEHPGNENRASEMAYSELEMPESPVTLRQKSSIAGRMDDKSK